MSPEEKDQKIERLEQENEALREKIAELERRLGLNSQTSSKPPSSDGLLKKERIRTSSLREKGKRPSGGQIGRIGQTLEQVLEPENIVEHPTPCSCSSCGCDIEEGRNDELVITCCCVFSISEMILCDFSRNQMFPLPIIKQNVTCE